MDLSGDGLVGRVKKALGIGPFDTSNPLSLNPTNLVGGTNEFLLSLPPSLDVAEWRLQITANGSALSGGWSLTPSGSGQYSLLLTKHFLPPGQYVLQVVLHESTDSPAHPAPAGPLLIWNNDCSLWLDPLANIYGSVLVLDASLDAQVVTCGVTLYDESGNILTNWVSQNTSGGIYTEVDLTALNGGAGYDGDSLTVGFDPQPQVAPQDASSPKERIKYVRGRSYNGDTMEFAYGWNDNPMGTSGRKRAQMYQGGIVDVLFDPSRDNQYQPTWLNAYTTKAFNMHVPDDQAVLKADMLNSGLNNFIYSGHGSENTFGASASLSDGLAIFYYTEIEGMYNNHLGKDGSWDSRGRAFRFVMLNSCLSAASDSFAIAFGFSPSFNTVDDFRKRGLDPAAFVGWTNSFDLPELGLGVPDNFANYEQALEVFTSAWMNEAPLSYCLKAASGQILPTWPDTGLSFPMSTKYRIIGTGLLTRSGTFIP